MLTMITYVGLSLSLLCLFLAYLLFLTGIKQTEPKVGELAKILSY